MDKREMLDRLAANGDERLLLGRVWDKYEQCRRRNLPQGTGFLSPAEQAAAQRLLNALSVSEGYTFWGGYDGAQRRQLWFLPDWQEAPEEDAVRVVRASFYEEDSLTHRDILGSLMALGVTRETLGDILVSPRWADVLATGPAAELLLRDPSVRTLRAVWQQGSVQVKAAGGCF
jgi:RNA-binding protein YlmH